MKQAIQRLSMNIIGNISILSFCRRLRRCHSSVAACSFHHNASRDDNRKRQRHTTSGNLQAISNSRHFSPLSSTKTQSSRQLLYNAIEATALVDSLLQYTRTLMGSPGSISRHVIAFSGGVDSSLAAALVQKSAIDESVQLVLGISPAVSTEQIQQAEEVARHLQADLQLVETLEGKDATYVANEGKACYVCKTHLYSTLQAIAARQKEIYRESQSGLKQCSTSTHTAESPSLQNAHAIDAVNTFARIPFQLYNGTNADDVQDPTRLGLVAAQEFKVYSPLIRFSKESVRLAARHLGLPNWMAAASPCLRSRLAWGVPATQDHLERMGQAERIVRSLLEPSVSANVRVRLFAGNRACLEVDGDLVERAERIDWDEVLVDKLGFASLEIREFKSGSVARKEKEYGRDHVVTSSVL
jgi:pyridinium-3,5-biscarboxylic acid mononucleotide sulfurtransferase